MLPNTKVYKQLPARFDMCGKFLGYPLQVIEDQKIKPTMAKRIYEYAIKVAKESGFDVVET